MKKIKIELNNELVSSWSNINVADTKQREVYDKLVNSIAEFEKEMIIARHSSDSIEDILLTGEYRKSMFVLETEYCALFERVALVAIEIYRENNGQKKTFRPIEIRQRYFLEYNEELKHSTCTEGLKKWNKFFFYRGKKGSRSIYDYNFTLDDVTSALIEIKGEI